MNKTFTHWILSVIFLAVAVAPGGGPASPAAGADAGVGPLVSGPLPPAPRTGGPTLFESLWSRRSVRRFADRPLTRDELGRLLWAAGGVNRPEGGRRTAPSAWEAYAVSIYVTSASGTAVYDPLEHTLRPAGTAAAKDLRREIPRAEATQAAPLQLILVADFSRYPARVSPESRRYLAHADCGVIAQNLYLAAGALGLGTVMTADARRESKELLGLGEEQMALYVLPVGRPAPEAAVEKAK